MMNGNGKATRRSLFAMCAVALGAGWLLHPTAASAGQFELRVAAGDSSAWVSPVYHAGRRIVTPPAVCEQRPRRIWHEPVYELRRVAVNIPAKVVVRRVAQHGRFGQIIGHRTVRRVVEPARTVWRTERVLVRAGYYETVYERVCTQRPAARVLNPAVVVRPGHPIHSRVAGVNHGLRLHGPVAHQERHRARENGWSVALGIGR